MSSIKNVSAATVRAWGRENIDLIPEAARAGLGATARGRLHPQIQEAFKKAHKGRKAYVAKVAEAQTLSVPVVGLDKNGRKMTKSVTITTHEARVAMGQPTSTRGRIALGTLSDVLSQAEAAKVADTFQ